MTEKVEPKWAHDCDWCTFLGNVREHDLYFCVKGSTGPQLTALAVTVIARWGDDGHEYKSGFFHANDRELLEAERRAKVAGLL